MMVTAAGRLRSQAPRDFGDASPTRRRALQRSRRFTSPSMRLFFQRFRTWRPQTAGAVSNTRNRPGRDADDRHTHK